MQKRWIFTHSTLDEQSSTLSQSLNIHKKLAAILLHRGVHNYEEAKAFFRPQLAHLHDPFLMTGMRQAVNRLKNAFKNNEKILVFGDYDVDGTTSVALVFSYLSKYSSSLDFYIPDRYTEGYGISFNGIDYAHNNNISLIIALDCGIKAHDKVNYAKQKGIDFIICDHHLPGETLPEAICLDPKRNDCNYPFKELSGCGVGFKFMQAFSIEMDYDSNELFDYIDFCAVSIAADIVPVTGENRILAYYGIQKLNVNPSLGLNTLLQICGKKGNVTITDLLFIIGPRINAAGRITNGRFAVELLISTNESKATEFAGLVNDNNIERRLLDKKITSQALTMINSDSLSSSKKSTVLYNPDWHKGVIGIVASRVTEHYYRPTVLLTGSNGKATGSARSVKDFDIHAAIEECAHLLEQFGGHKFAAGLTMKIENIEAFSKKFEEVVSKHITPEQLIPSIEIDAEIEPEVLFEDIVDGLPKFLRVLKQMAPFGPGNLNPVFVSKGLLDAGYAKVVGDSHLKCWIYHPSKPHLKVDAIGFGLGSFAPALVAQKPFDMVFTIEENEWNGKSLVQLNIKDIKLHEN